MTTPSEAIADIRIRAPTRGNRSLERLIDAVNADPQVKAWWHAAGVNAERLRMSDHSWVHIQVVTNIALRLARLLFRRGVVPDVVTGHGMHERDAEVVIAAAALFHCVGMSIHRRDHEAYSLFLTADKLGGLLADSYDEPERSVVVSEAMHAIISHRSKGAPFTVEGAIVRVADALDMAKGRSRVAFEEGHQNIHSLSAYAIESVKISPGREQGDPRRDRDEQLGRHLPGRRGPRDEAARHAAGGAHRGRGAHRRRARAAPRAGLQALTCGARAAASRAPPAAAVSTPHHQRRAHRHGAAARAGARMCP